MLKSIRLNGYAESFTADEVVANLEVILNREQLLRVVAARVAGFSRVAAGALLGVDGHPDELARVVEIFEQTTSFEILVEDVVAAVGERGIRAAWERQKEANASAAKDTLMSIHTKIVGLAAMPVAVHKREKAQRQFQALLTGKRTGDSRPQFEGFTVTHY